MLSVCETIYNRCIQRLVILYAQTILMNPNRIPKLGQCNLLYRSKAPAEKWA